MILFQNSTDPKYQLLENPKKRCSFVAHSTAIFGLVVLSISITLISLVIIWDQIKQMQHKTETLDFVLFGPEQETSDIVRVSWYRSLVYALSNNRTDATSSNESANNIYEVPLFKPNESVETYQHVNKKYSLICYYVTPSRSSSADRLLPAGLDPFLCTHIIVAFATVEKNRIHFTDGKIMDSIVRLRMKNPRLKIMLSVVSFNSADEGFALMVTSNSSRNQFIESAMRIMFEYSLDGIDLDWEFPAWPPGKNVTQKDEFVVLLKELKMNFGSKFIISVAVAAPLTIIDQSYDVPSIAKYVDFINVMSYDYHTYVWYLPIIGPNAPLYRGPKENGYFATLNTNFTIYLWLQKGMPKEKIILGMSIYGHSWTLVDPLNHEYGAVAAGFGSLGERGFVSYREICKFSQSNETKVVFTGDTRVPYAYKQKEWISFDDEISLSYKAEYIAEHGLAGGMIFSLNMDDFEGNNCKNGTKFPLVSRVKTVLSDDNL